MDELRSRLRGKFQHYLNVDVSGLVVGADPEAARLACHTLSAALEKDFDPCWDELRPSYGGTMGHHTAYVQAKANWLAAHLEGADEGGLKQECKRRLRAFWHEWAGFQLTLDEFRPLDPEV